MAPNRSSATPPPNCSSATLPPALKGQHTIAQGRDRRERTLGLRSEPAPPPLSPQPALHSFTPHAGRAAGGEGQHPASPDQSNADAMGGTASQKLWAARPGKRTPWVEARTTPIHCWTHKDKFPVLRTQLVPSCATLRVRETVRTTVPRYRPTEASFIDSRQLLDRCRFRRSRATPPRSRGSATPPVSTNRRVGRARFLH